MERSWILVGMMGVGKSAVGRELAQATGRTFIDTDALLQQRLGRPVSQLFRVYGEPAFRDHETALLRSLEPGHSVISTGGGIVVRPANWVEMRRLGITLYLKAAPEELIERLSMSKKRRPLLEVDNWQDRLKQLLRQREALYSDADIIVELEGDGIVGAATKALTALQERSH